MKKLSKMLICLMLCFIVTGVAANGTVYKKKHASADFTRGDAWAGYTIDATFVVKNGKNYLYSWNSAYYEHEIKNVGYKCEFTSSNEKFEKYASYMKKSGRVNCSEWVYGVGTSTSSTQLAAIMNY